jgi:signal-transduction protein with cAMP-binding, CBS, and nucleotidyltransferase domain
MWENDFGCLPVTEGDGAQRLVGMITDRDICMAAYFAGRPLHEIRVADAMTREVCACNPGDDLSEARAIMREAAVRRLPVIDASEQPIGLLSLADLAREAVRERGAMNRDITVGEVGLVLGAVCELRSLARLAQAETLAQAPGAGLEARAVPAR